jgi:hypothetical protein
MSWLSASPEFATFIAAELFFLLSRSPDLLVVLKSDLQRTEEERARVLRGLSRSLWLEGVIFVPASGALLLLLAPLVIRKEWTAMSTVSGYAMLGLVSYGFPFAIVRTIVTRVALRTLKEFASIASKVDDGGSGEEE